MNSSKPTTDLSTFNNDHYRTGRSAPVRLVWYVVSWLFFESGLLLPYGLKRAILRLFGAQVGLGAVIKPRVKIKFPWRLIIGNYVWIGEKVWIDNLDNVSIGNHACLSQGAMLLCGNHDFKKKSFDLITKPIIVEDGAWIGAKSVVTQGVTVGSHAVLTVSSVASTDLTAYSIFRGNPAQKVKDRNMLL